MKSFILLSLFLVTNAFAVDVCSFEETWQFDKAMKAQKIRPVRTVKDHQQFTSMEKKLIHRTVTLQTYTRDNSLAQSLEDFTDLMTDGTRGANAGKIVYYNFEGKQLILVHYWPGDNEYGAFYSINKNGSLKLVARVNDSFIECK
jgi:hypothetical protein